jgi:transmembrane sensor
MKLYCNYIENLSVDYFSGSLQSDEKTKVASHLRKCDSCRESFEYIRCGITALDALKPVSADQYLWDDIEFSISETVRARAIRRDRKISEKRAEIRNMAAVIAVFLSLIGAYFFLPDFFARVPANSEFTRIYVTEPAERREIQLGELAYIQLNYDSILEINREHEPEHVIMNLSGEAFFRIDTDTVPVHIVTSSGNIRINGTSFNVKTRNNRTVVAVTEGEVLLAKTKDESDSRRVIVPAGKVGIIGNDGSVPTLVDSDLHTHLLWRENQFVFNRSPITDVISELQRAYNVTINLDINGTDDILITGSFQREPLPIILEEITMATGTQIVRENGDYIIRRLH